MKHDDITRKIIGAAYKVYNTLGFGYLESVYQNAILLELNRAGLKCEKERPLYVFYEGERVGQFLVDIFVEEEIVVELKAVRRILIEHEVQLVNYLTALQKDFGLLINFGHTRVEVKRKFRNSFHKDQSILCMPTRRAPSPTGPDA